MFTANLITRFALILGLVYWHPIARASSSVEVRPVNPTTADNIVFDYRVESLSSPATLDKVEIEFFNSEIKVIVYFVAGQYSEVSYLAGSAKIGKLAAGHYSINLYYRARDELPGSSYSLPIPAANMDLFVLLPPPIPLVATEFYHPGLNHYFMTANAEEIAYLVANATTLGWMLTGQNFRVLSPDDLAEAQVCRFYGSTNPGPNSHFYTSNTTECEYLKQLQAQTPLSLPRWNFEGISFRVISSKDGSCRGSAAIPIFRFYNNRALQNDSNHRYVTSTSLYNKMLSENWISEGVVMCASTAE